MPVEVVALYRAHAARVWRYARARVPSDTDAEDVTSEVFIRAMRSHHRFDPDKGTEGAWIAGISRHVVADWWRRRAPEDPVDVVAEQASVQEDPTADIAVRGEAVAGIQAFLDRLSDREREAVALRFGAELSSPEIGAVMEISPTAARMLVHRGMTKLRELMGDE